MPQFPEHLPRFQPSDPAAKAAAALKKKQDAHNKAINDWDAVFEERQRFLDTGIGDEFKDWERDLKRMREEAAAAAHQAFCSADSGFQVVSRKLSARDANLNR